MERGARCPPGDRQAARLLDAEVRHRVCCVHRLTQTRPRAGDTQRGDPISVAPTTSRPPVVRTGITRRESPRCRVGRDAQCTQQDTIRVRSLLLFPQDVTCTAAGIGERHRSQTRRRLLLTRTVSPEQVCFSLCGSGWPRVSHAREEPAENGLDINPPGRRADAPSIALRRGGLGVGDEQVFGRSCVCKRNSYGLFLERYAASISALIRSKPC